MWHRKFLFVLALMSGLYAVPAVAAVPVLVEGRWLEANIHDARVVVVDMSDDDTQYQRFHLPGAVRLPYETLVKERKADKVKVRLDDPELAALFGKLGITREKYVVIYDDMGGLNAARLFWELERLGHPRVSVLDGGLVSWILDGRKVVNSAPRPVPAPYVLNGAGRANEASLDDVKTAMQTKSTRLLDVRSDEEYLGEPKKPRTGHIPGARWWPWERGVDFTRGFTRRDEATLKQTLRSVGATDPQAPIIAYCRSGHRAAQSYLTLRSLGYENVRVYANSMNEYGLKPTDPLTQGAKP
jgi:thiosulfate/3-mercaptopyruvate sulfurtransferase